MNLKINKVLSLLLSLTIVLMQLSIPTYAADSELPPEESTQSVKEVTKNVSSSNTQTEENEIQTEANTTPYAAAINPKVVYTQATKSNSDRSGDGSQSNPYNRFEDAVANVADGGTIIIKTGRFGFINAYDEYGNFPFIIDKNITIRSESDSVKALLDVRTGGIILDGDVTFENISFAFSNKLHDSIFANGHTLKLVNCVRNSGSRQIDLFAGSLYDVETKTPIAGVKYDKNANPIEVLPTPGNHGRIIIETSKDASVSEFGKVFAGSMNGNFKGNADIEIIDNGDLDLVSIHSCGASETPPGPMFDLTEPIPPTEKPNQYTVDGTVNISLTNHKADINGEGAKAVHATVSTIYPIGYFTINDVNSITIKNGTLIPNDITWKNGEVGDLTLSNSNSHLDLSKMNTLDVNDFSSNGMITLQRDGKLNIHNNITGQTIFQTVHGAVDHSFSGPVNLGHAYITSLAGSGMSNSFIFTPEIFFQSHYQLEKIGNDWIISEDLDKIESIIPTQITSFNFDNSQYELIINPSNTIFAEMKFTINPDFILSDAALWNDLDVEIFVNGKKARKDPDYLAWYVDDLNLSLDLIDKNLLSVGPLLNSNSVDVKLGVYDVTISLPLYNISATSQLNVTSETISNPENTAVDFNIESSYGDFINMANFGDDIKINAFVKPSTNSIHPLALQNHIDFIVNGHLVDSSSIKDNTANLSLPITKENGFKVGSNKIKVVYGGSTNLRGSSIEKEFTVNKMTPSLSLSSDICVTYDGQPHGLNATVDQIIDLQPTVYYYTDSHYSQGQTTQPPVNPGTYYVKAVVEETDFSYGAEATGKVKIEKATPDMMLSGTIINNDHSTNDLIINLNLSFPINGHAPMGEIEFKCVDSNHRIYTHTEALNYGNVTHVFHNLSEGTATITATYKPHTNEISYSTPDPVTEKFEVISNFIPIKDFELLATELQFYINADGTISPSTSDIKLPFNISPNNASNQSITWKSSNPSVVSINSSTGELEIHSKGEAFITARTKDGNFTHSCKINIIEGTNNIIPVQSISLNASCIELNLSTNVSHKLTASLHPTNATYSDIIWKSKDNNIATVDATGKITAKSIGNTQIIAITKTGGKVATCDIKVTSAPSISISQFKDIGNHWAKSDIQFALDKGLFKGISDTEFGPNITTTRGMFVTVLYRYVGSPKIGTLTFADVNQDSYCANAIAWASSSGIVSGISKTQFAPNQALTREQLVSILYRYAQMTGMNIGSNSNALSKFKDAHKVANWSKEAMNWAVSLGIIQGNSTNQVEPQGKATRAQVASILKRFILLS